MALATGIAFRDAHRPAEPATALVAKPEPEVTWAPVEAAPTATPPVETEQAPAPPKPKPAPVESAAAALPALLEPPPERASPTYDITVSSRPLGAFRVHVDDVDRGLTPAMKLLLPEGQHTLVLVADDGTRTPPKTITVAKFAPKHWTWNTETGRWDY